MDQLEPRRGGGQLAYRLQIAPEGLIGLWAMSTLGAALFSMMWDSAPEYDEPIYDVEWEPSQEEAAPALEGEVQSDDDVDELQAEEK